MNIIRIDTANNLITRVVLATGSKTFKLEENRATPGDQNVLELIEKLITEHKLKISDIHSIEVNEGPGSFTGLRVGASIANALSFGIQVSVNGKPLGDIVNPQY